MIRNGIRRLPVRRKHVAAWVLRSQRALLASTRRPAPGANRILCYHGVGTPEWGVNDVPVARFQRHLELALEAGYRFVPAAELTAPDPEGWRIAITFDDGLASVVSNAAPILERLGIPWTLFVTTGWVQTGSRTSLFVSWDDLRCLAAAGVEIGSHSVSHPKFTTIDTESADRELKQSRKRIADELGIAPASFAIPFGQSRDWTGRLTQMARAAGYERIYAQTVNRHPAGTIARTFVTRFDTDRTFQAALTGAFDDFEEWY